jgi:PTH1 family peptidyl-tRNA hydrolase
MMKIIVGLGNPGPEYENTRHNAGFMAVEMLFDNINLEKMPSNEEGWKWESKYEAMIARVGDLLLVKPQSYMNRSGEAVSKVINYYKVNLDELLVIHDDLDISLGSYKFGFAKGPKVHNGVNSIEQALGNTGFWRVRIGVDNREGEGRNVPGDKYVLMKLKPDEGRVLEECLEEAVREVEERFIEK